jgi:RimJ/RimL family protein N-acetyltransferase
MWDRDDASLINGLHSTLDTTRYLTGGEPWSLPKAQERLEKWFEEHERDGTCKYKLLSRDDDRFIGRAGFSLYGGERSDFELGYSLARTEWGKGYATEIAAALRDWFFDRKLASKFIAFTHPDNSASQNVLTKIGMRCCTPMIIDGLECPTFEYSSDMRR